MGLGFGFAESLSGSYYLHEDTVSDLAISLTLRVEVDGLRQFARDRVAKAEGFIDVEGITEHAQVTGTVGMRLLDQKRVTYDLAFDRYRLRGQREFFVYDAIDSLTVLGASLYDSDDVEIGRAMLRFDPRNELPAMLKSFRPRVRGLLPSRGR